MQIHFPNLRSRLRRLFMVMPAVALLVSAPVGANLVITVANVSSTSPSSGNALEIDLINTGLGSVSLGGFSFEITMGDPHITFTSATTATVAPYVFAGGSEFGPTINTSTGQTLDAGDFSTAVGGAAIAAGATVGLGHVFFDISAGDLSGLVAVMLSPLSTSLVDVSGNIIPATLINGSITIAASAVPEPSALALMFLGLLVLASIRKRSSR